MTTTDPTDVRIRLASEVAEVRDELAALQERFHAVMREVRHLPGGEHLYRLVDAYPGLRLDRDMGAGRDADGWLAKVADLLEAGPDDDD